MKWNALKEGGTPQLETDYGVSWDRKNDLDRLMREGKLKGHRVGGTWRFYRRDVESCVSEEYAKEETSKGGNG